MMNILIDAGHGPATKGKRTPENLQTQWNGFGVVEYETNRRLAAELGAELRRGGLEVGSLPFYINNCLSQRVRDANEIARLGGGYSTTLLFSCHCNAAPDGPNMTQPRGLEFVVHSQHSPAWRIAAEATKRLDLEGVIVREVKINPKLTLLARTAMPAIIIEFGFMTNRADVELLCSASRRAELVRNVAISLLPVIS